MEKNNSKINISRLQLKSLEKGKKLLREHQYQEALDIFSKLVKKDKESSTLWATQGVLLLKLNQLGEAEESFNKAIDLEPKDPYYWAGLGYVLAARNNFSEAENAFQKALEKEEKFEDILSLHIEYIQEQLD